MGIIRVHTPDEYVTLINLFTVNPKDQLGLTRVQLGDMYWYGKQLPDHISANFHRSLDGVRFFNYGQWRGAESLARAHQSPEFKAHFGNYRYFEMTPDPHLYEVTRTSFGRPVEIRWPSRLTVSLRVLSVQPEDQARVLALADQDLAALERSPGLLGGALHRSLDGQRVAVYAQWRDEVAFSAALDQPASRKAEAEIGEAGVQSDLRTYEVAGTSDDVSPAPPGW